MGKERIWNLGIILLIFFAASANCNNNDKKHSNENGKSWTLISDEMELGRKSCEFYRGFFHSPVHGSIRVEANRKSKTDLSFLATVEMRSQNKSPYSLLVEHPINGRIGEVKYSVPDNQTESYELVIRLTSMKYVSQLVSVKIKFNVKSEDQFDYLDHLPLYGQISKDLLNRYNTITELLVDAHIPSIGKFDITSLFFFILL